jgi:protoporphyrinogen oxidase
VSSPRVAIVGGGILGVVLAYRLAQRGAAVELYERAAHPGGLASSMQLAGYEVDRFYHVILPSDQNMIGLAEEVGLGDALRFRPSGVGFLSGGELYPFNGLGDFARFPVLTPAQRVRLAWFVAQCQARRSIGKLDDIPLESWLARHCGRGLSERIWQPLLDSRFDGRPEGLPATYLWARTRRMGSARKSGRGAEEMGSLEGGHQRLIDRLVERARDLGATVHTGRAVDGLTMTAGAVDGIVTGGEAIPYDLVIATLPPPLLPALLPDSLQPLLEPYPKRYLGVVDLVLALRTSPIPYYSINICDPTPVTTVVDTSHVVGTDHCGGLHLVHMPRYCDVTAPEHDEANDSVYRRFTDFLATASPGFRHEDVVDWTVQRARIVEPVHGLGAGRRIAPVWPVAGLGLASNAQIYPSLLSGESVSLFAQATAEAAAERLGLPAV